MARAQVGSEAAREAWDATLTLRGCVTLGKLNKLSEAQICEICEMEVITVSTSRLVCKG